MPGAFAYQCEYVLAGKNEDRENLKSVLERLLLLRFGMNFTYLLSSRSATGGSGGTGSRDLRGTGNPHADRVYEDSNRSFVGL